jgi:hypothetical protein
MNQFERIAFQASDGHACDLLRLRRDTPATKTPVLLVHGAGVRANIFNPPTKKNIVTMLAENGYDVWLENWRASIDLPANEWDLDQVALNDHPAAVKKIVGVTGAKNIKAIIHCQGSTSFMISASLGLLPEVDLIISNAVSLHPVVPRYSRVKLKVFVPMVKLLFKYLNPQWGLSAPTWREKMLRGIVKGTHFEDDTLVGKFVSFTYGAGFPALWQMENIDEPTKDWIQHEFAAVPLTFFDHMKKCVAYGALVPFHPNNRLPSDYVSGFKSTARIVLFAGELNHCFKAESQQRTFEHFDRLKPKYHGLYILKGYSHLDVFLGKNAHEDVFPLMLKELNNP